MPYPKGNFKGGMHGLLMDISEESTQSNDYKFWLTFQQAAVGIALVRPDGRFMRANPELCTLLGYDESELKELSLQNITHRSDVDVDTRMSQRLVAGEISSYRSEKRFITRQGLTVWGLQSVSVVRDRFGKPLQFITVVRDITAQKTNGSHVPHAYATEVTPTPEPNVQAATNASAGADDPRPPHVASPQDDARLIELLSSLPLGLMVVDAMGETWFANETARNLLGPGVAPEFTADADGTDDGNLHVYSAYKAGSDGLYPLDEAPITRALMGQQAVVSDIEIRQPQGVVPVQVWAGPVYDEHGKVAYAVAAIDELRTRVQVIEQQTQTQALRVGDTVAGLLQLAGEVATGIGLAGSLEDAMQLCLDRICEVTGLPVGHMLLARGDLYARNGAHVQLASSGVWHLKDPDNFKALRKVTQNMSFDMGAELPGQVLTERQAVWTVGPGLIASSPRAKELEASGITTGFAFPVPAEGAVVGVMEFFSVEPLEPDQTFLDVMSLIGANLGNAIVRRTATDELERARGRYELVGQIAGELLSVHDVEGKYMYAGKAAAGLLGYEPAELVGSSLLTYCHPNDVPRLNRLLGRYLAGSDEQSRVKYRFRHKGGDYMWLEMSCQPLIATYGYRREIIAMSKVTQAELEVAHRMPSGMATTRELKPLQVSADEALDLDPLTGLYNRESVEDMLTTKLSSRRASSFPVGCLFIDLDDFDELAGTYGEETRDEVVRRVAEMLDQTCRDDDFLGRYSGSSFVIVLPNTDAAGTIIVGEKVLRRMRAMEWPGTNVTSPVSVSIGGTCLRHGTMLTLPELMELLGSQLMQAKGSGGDCIIMNARETSRTASSYNPLGGWSQPVRLPLNGQAPGAAPGHAAPPEPGNRGN
ncbi:MAG TPA: PAS domain S-box protein [Chloroflexia bacterium]|jgi:diguanylate cyclase (GGDEF)-like protein/PAS domain S-box-containing protein